MAHATRGTPEASFSRRVEPGSALADDAETVANACYDMARRFHRGGKLVVFGNGGPATDAQHVSVEFVHPVIVGKRALPSISLTTDAPTFTGIARTEGYDETFAAQVRLLARPGDIALGVSTDGRCTNVLRALEEARAMGLLTIALTGGDGEIAKSAAVDHVIAARSADPHIVKEVHVTAYHILWELVHVFLEQPALLGPEVVR